MRFSFIASALAFVAGAIAQSSVGPNAFNIGTQGTPNYVAGQAYTLTWSNKQGSTVTILLRTGDRSDLHTVSTLVSNYPNSGTYSWTPDPTLPTGADYALEIIDDDDQSMVNFSGQFVIQSSVEAVATDSSTSLVTVTTPSAAASSTILSATTTGSASAAASTTTGASTLTTKASSSTSSAASTHATHASSTTSAAAAAVPTNAAAKPAAGAVSGLLLVAAGFAIAL